MPEQFAQGEADLTPHQKLKHDMAHYALRLGKDDLEEFIKILLDVYFSRVSDPSNTVEDETLQQLQ